MQAKKQMCMWAKSKIYNKREYTKLSLLHILFLSLSTKGENK